MPAIGHLPWSRIVVAVIVGLIALVGIAMGFWFGLHFGR